MPLLQRPLVFLFLALLMAGVSHAAPADGRDGDKGRQKKQASRDGDSLSESVRRIERATQGQILSAERVQFDGRDVNRVKVVDDRGRVRIYVDDPEKSGRSDGTDDDDKPARRTHRDDSDDPNL